jgi:hypothetical protein
MTNELRAFAMKRSTRQGALHRRKHDMTNNSERHENAGPGDERAFIEAVETVLDYLWDDEQQHYAECGEAGKRHVFQSLQLIRTFINTMKQQMPPAVDETRGPASPRPE